MLPVCSRVPPNTVAVAHCDGNPLFCASACVSTHGPAPDTSAHVLPTVMGALCSNRSCGRRWYPAVRLLSAVVVRCTFSTLLEPGAPLSNCCVPSEHSHRSRCPSVRFLRALHSFIHELECQHRFSAHLVSHSLIDRASRYLTYVLSARWCVRRGGGHRLDVPGTRAEDRVHDQERRGGVGARPRCRPFCIHSARASGASVVSFPPQSFTARLWMSV